MHSSETKPKRRQYIYPTWTSDPIEEQNKSVREPELVTDGRRGLEQMRSVDFIGVPALLLVVPGQVPGLDYTGYIY